MTDMQATGDAGATGGGPRFLSFPSTKLGWWSAWLGVAFVVMMLINGAFMQLSSDAWWQRNLLPFYGIGMLGVGLAAGIVGLIAVLRQHERSIAVWVMMLPALFVIFFVVGEFAFPH